MCIFFIYITYTYTHILIYCAYSLKLIYNGPRRRACKQHHTRRYTLNSLSLEGFYVANNFNSNNHDNTQLVLNHGASNEEQSTSSLADMRCNFPPGIKDHVSRKLFLLAKWQEVMIKHRPRRERNQLKFIIYHKKAKVTRYLSKETVIDDPRLGELLVEYLDNLRIIQHRSFQHIMNNYEDVYLFYSQERLKSLWCPE